MKNHLFNFVNEKHDGITNQHILLSIKSSEPNNKRDNDKGFLHPKIRKKKLVWLLFLLSITLFISISICLHYLTELTQPKELYFKQEVNKEELAAEIKSEIKRPNKDDSFIVQDASHANYRLVLKMMSETDFWVEGTIEVENRSDKNWMDLQFYFIPNMFQAAKIKEITINGEKMKYDLYDDSLRIPLYQALQIGKKLNVHFAYTLTPPKDELRLFRSDKSISLAEWYPMLCTYLNGWKKKPL